MAETVKASADPDVAIDLIAGANFQRVKLTLGADGVNDGDVSASNPVPVSGPLTDTQLRAASVPVSGPLTDAALRASAVPVSLAASVAVTGPLTDTQLRAVELPVSLASVPLPTGAATEATLAALASSIFAEDTPHTSGEPGQLMLALRSDTDASTADNGDYTVLKLDETGRLKVASQPASYTPTTGNITANGQTIFVDCQRFSNLMIHCAGTFSTVSVVFEGSLNSTNGTDGNWFGVQAVRSNANTIEITTGNLSAAPAYAWELSVNALKYFRIRATAWTSGTQIWTYVPGTYATEPIPAAQASASQTISGSVTSTPLTPTASIINSAATTNGSVVKATAGNIYGIVASNNGAGSAYLKIHNSATVTAGTTAVALWILIPAGQTVRYDWGALGMRFGTGICYSITGAVGDTDTTAIAAGQVKVLTAFV